MKLLKSFIISVLCYLSLFLLLDIALIVSDFINNKPLQDISIEALKTISFI